MPMSQTPNPGQLWSTGDFKSRFAAAPDPGWIVADGSTIGNVGSGAGRANIDTLALFTLWWTDYSDAQLPILTSAGAASARGVSAAADWAALKRLTTFDMRGRFARYADGSANINGTKQDDAMQGHIHVLFTSVSASSTGGTVNGVTTTGANVANSGVPITDGTNGTPRIAAETRPMNIAMLGCVKL